MASNQILSLMLGTQWTPVSLPATISYTILGDDTTDQFGRPANIVNPAFQQAVNLAVAAWNAVANVGLHFVPNSTVNTDNPFASDVGEVNILFHPGPLSDGVVGLTQTTTSGSTITHADITMDNLYFEPSDYLPDPVTYGFATMLHELGHALGLAHPDDSEGGSYLDIQMTGNDATNDGSVMTSVVGTFGTETATGGVPITPMIYDIQALQYLYGANHNYHPGNDTYSFNGSQLSETLWDGGGTDMISATGYTAGDGVTINLREGIDYVTKIGDARIWNAFGAVIENARGSSGDDSIQGSNANNFLAGNQGADTINGYNSNDTVRGGQGTDSVNGNAGADFVAGDRDNDTVHGGADNDVLHGGKENDVLLGEEGNDTLFGDLGDDSLTGGAGSDVFAYDSTSTGVDVITDFTSGTDTLQFASSVFATAAAAAAASSGGVISVSGGGTITLTGIADLDASDIVIV